MADAPLECWEDGTLIERWDNVSRVYTDFRPESPQSRPYTDAENAAADALAAAALVREQRAAARVAVKAIITDLQAEKTRADAVIAKSNAQISGGDTKDVARVAKRIADAVIDLARFVQDMQP